MNANDRKQVAKAKGLIEQARGILSDLADQEEEKFENLSEGLQESEMGQAINGAAESLRSAVDELENLESSLEELEG